MEKDTLEYLMWWRILFISVLKERNDSHRWECLVTILRGLLVVIVNISIVAHLSKWRYYIITWHLTVQLRHLKRGRIIAEKKLDNRLSPYQSCWEHIPLTGLNTSNCCNSEHLQKSFCNDSSSFTLIYSTEASGGLKKVKFPQDELYWELFWHLSLVGCCW